jgi:hypothetical protein
MKSYLRRKLINFLAKHLFKTITAEDFIREKKGRLYINGKMLNAESEIILRDEAGRVQNSTLWKMIKLEAEYHALDKVLRKSESIDDVVAGKLMIYIIDIMDSRMNTLQKRN